MTEAKQGHLYRLDSVDVLALESGPVVKVGILSRGDVWFVAQQRVNAERLKPLPMKYHGNEVP